jgi:tetratricopeptide (TPR) repeat protein
VAEICTRLDGLPLAIELVAARLRLLPPLALLARLDDRLALLTDGPRDLPSRQQTLRSAIVWSYDLLSAEEQQLFRWMGVFVGGCKLEAADAMLRTEGRGLNAASTSSALIAQSTVLDGLAALLNHSLIKQEIEPDDTPRFLMLETVHEYALEQLQASGELDELNGRHARYYLTLAEMVELKLQGTEQADSLVELDAEYENLRQALAWSLGPRGDESIGLRLAGALGNYWNIRGQMSEGRRWLEHALATDCQSGEPAAHGHSCQKARAKALNWAAVLAWQQNDFTQTRVLADESLAQYRELGDRRGIATALFNLGIVAFRYAEYEHAVTLLEEDLALSQEIGDKRLICSALSVLGNVARAQADLVRAASLHQQCLELAYQLKEPQNLTSRLNALGETQHYQGNHSRAAMLFEEAFALARKHGEKPGMAVSLYGLGLVAHAQHDYAQARVRLLESLLLRREIGDRNGIANCLEGLGAVAVAHRQPEQAIRLCASAEGLRQAVGTRLNLVQRPVYEQTLDAARAQLADEIATAAWAAGRAMTLDQAIAYALDERQIADRLTAAAPAPAPARSAQ